MALKMNPTMMRRPSKSLSGTINRSAIKRSGYASLLGVGLGLVLLSGCSTNDSSLPGLTPGNNDPDAGVTYPDSGNNPTTDSGACSEGATRECHKTLGQKLGILSCYVGTETCKGGTWGACTDGIETTQPAPSSNAAQNNTYVPGKGPVVSPSLSNSQPCVNNPCDPSCQNYNEQPDGGVKPDAAGTIFNWQLGNLDDFPNGLVKKGLKEPCSTGSDCQFDSYCFNPVSGTCPHDICQPGAALTAGCNSCAAQICDADPSCCDWPYGGSCAHDPCETGGKLKKNCDSCVTAICNADSYCCNNSWDSACKAKVQSICGKTCPGPGNWTQACADKVGTVCAAKCISDPPCAHAKCVAGDGLDASCNSCVGKICQTSPECCENAASCSHDPCSTGAPLTASCSTCAQKICNVDSYCCNNWWDSICVNEMKSVCGATCPIGWNENCVAKVQSVCKETCQTGSGSCFPWVPGQTDDSCTGVDLTVGVPCGTSIPVCNHGKTAAPAGVRLVHFPANSNQYPKCNPDQTHPQMYECFTDKPIPPGQCIDVTTCPKLVGNREIMVNPDGTGHINECTCQNNWSLFSANTNCGAPSCSGAVAEAQLKQVNMFITVDKSGSMSSNGWTSATNSLKSFFADPSAAGLGVALRFWPDDSPVAGCGCNIAACSAPLVPLGNLTVPTAPTDTQEQLLINAVNSRSPGGSTPMYGALGGAVSWAKSYQLSHPDEVTIVILITDGQPNGCDTNINNIAALAADGLNTAGVRTYVIGIEGVSTNTINTIANAGGGQAFFVNKVVSGTVNGPLLDALNTIKGNNISCDFALPNQGLFDPSNAQVYYENGSGTKVTINKVGNAGACGAGWYYDNPSDPSTIHLCSSTCQAIKATVGAKIKIELGCPPVYDPVVYKQTYEGICPEGTNVVWGYMSYSTATPGDSNVTFQAHTGGTVTELASSPLFSLATAKATPAPDTQQCPLSGPAPCPVDLYQKLGGIPTASKKLMELVVTLNPSSDKTLAPKTNNWQITYSCPDSE
jgi:hypothetical protein